MKTLKPAEPAVSSELSGLAAQSQALLKSHVDTYTRKDGVTVQAHDDKRQAAQPAAPGIGAQHAALRSSSKPGDLDHEANQVAAAHMEAGDHQSLKGSLGGMDTGARDHVLDHIHPDHWEGLGFKPLNKDKSVKDHDAKFGAKPAATKPKPAAKPKAAKPADAAPAAPVTKTQNEGYGFHGEAVSAYLREKHGPDTPYHKLPEGAYPEARKHAEKQFSAAADHLVKHGYTKSHDVAARFLDSRDGRHLHNETDGDLTTSKQFPAKTADAPKGKTMAKALFFVSPEGLGDLQDLAKNQKKD